MDSSGRNLSIQLLIILLLTVINAIFAASELAFVSVNQTKMKNRAESGDKRARTVLKLLEDSDDFLATIQVAITFAGFLSSASAANAFTDVVAGWLPNFPGAQTLATVIVTVILSYISLVFGELFPKQIALQMPDKTAMVFSSLISFVKKIGAPFVWFLGASTRLLQRITPINFDEQEAKFTREEMQGILSESHSEGSIDIEEYTMLEGVLSLDDKIAKEIMVPRTDTQMIDINDDKTDNINEILSSSYSRIPLYQEGRDNIIGIIHVKNILKAARTMDFEEMDLVALSNPPLFVPATMFIDDLLIEFKRQQQHMAILIDEYGGVEGILTLEDLIEEIVGEIDDESDEIKMGDIRKIEDGSYYVNGGLPIDKFNSYFDIEVDKNEFDTMAGAIIEAIGYVPQDDERIIVRASDYIIVTTRIENGRIYDLQIKEDPTHSIETIYELQTRGPIIEDVEEE